MVHLNITMDAKLFRRLKAQTPAKGLSSFISAAVRAKLRPSREDLNRAYQAAAQEPWRRAFGEDWSTVDGESWPG